MRPTTPHVFEYAISKPRLDSYKGYFKTKTVDEAIGLYMWNSELAACFGTLLSFFEIGLRNNIHRAMSQFYSGGKSSSEHWYDKIIGTLKPGTVKQLDDVRHEGPPHKRRPRKPQPSPDEIVSRVTFGFWPSVLGIVDPRYADQILPSIFPHHPLSATPADWGDKAKRKKALEYIYEINDFRNRLAHHEPLWKFSAVMDTSIKPARVVVPASQNYPDSVARFQRLIGYVDDAMHAMEQDFCIDLKQSSWRRRLDYLLSARGFARYRALKHCPENCTITPTAFRRNFPFIVKRNQPVHVRRSGSGGVFIPE